MVWIAQAETTTTIADVASEAWSASEWIALGAVAVALVSAAITAWSMWLNHLGSKNRLKHEAEMQVKQLAEDRRAASLATAAKAYRLSAEVQRHIDLPAVEKWAADGEFTISVEAKASVMAAADALELVTATGWSEEVRAGAGLVLITMMHFEHSAFATVQRLQRDQVGTEVEDRFRAVEIELVNAIVQFQGAIAGT